MFEAAGLQGCLEGNAASEGELCSVLFCGGETGQGPAPVWDCHDSVLDWRCARRIFKCL